MRTWSMMNSKEKICISIAVAWMAYLLVLLFVSYADRGTPDYTKGYEEGFYNSDTAKYKEQLKLSIASMFIHDGHAYANGYTAGYEAKPKLDAFNHKQTENVTIIAKYVPHRGGSQPIASPSRVYSVDFKAEDGNIHTTRISSEMYINLTEGKSYAITNLNGTYYGANDYDNALWLNATII